MHLFFNLIIGEMFKLDFLESPTKALKCIGTTVTKLERKEYGILMQQPHHDG